MFLEACVTFSPAFRCAVYQRALDAKLRCQVLETATVKLLADAKHTNGCSATSSWKTRVCVQVLQWCRRGAVTTFAAKELHFNKNGEALKRMQAGVDKLATVVGVTLGPKVCH